MDLNMTEIMDCIFWLFSTTKTTISFKGSFGAGLAAARGGDEEDESGSSSHLRMISFVVLDIMNFPGS
jgi:hypothetical protein